jgi:hypothetical protein
MTRSVVQTLLALGLAGCCFGGTPTGTGTGTPPPPPGTAPVVGAGGDVSLAPGFAPDPMMASGTAGGPVQASTYGMDCRGTVAMAPNHTYTLTAPFSTLRFSVTATADTTLVVRSPSGQIFCNDDTNGFNPEIVNSFPAGPVQVYVGTYSSTSTGAPYTMQVSQTGGMFAPPPPVMPTTAPVIGPGGIPQNCGMPVVAPFYGTIQVGSSIVLGGHSPWTGPTGDPANPFVTDDTNWAPEMGTWVGQRTIVTSLDGVDTAGCPGVRVTADSGQYFWRIRNASF